MQESEYFTPEGWAVLIGFNFQPIILINTDEGQHVTGSQFESRKQSGNFPGSKISKKVWIRASVKTVYRALTESKELGHWFCDRATCEAVEGKEFVAYWKTGKSSQKGLALFTRVVPGVALELMWIDDGSGENAQESTHTLSYEIRSKSGMTELVMVDKDEAAADDETMEILDRGWTSVLLELKDYCEHKERLAKPRKSIRSRPQKTSRD
jgi:uncharacterized protein YndB with AHSA1/START domain